MKSGRDAIWEPDGNVTEPEKWHNGARTEKGNRKNGMNLDILEMIRVFAVGGGICIIGQLLLDFTNLNAPKILVLFVAAGGILTALGLYQPVVDFAGSGATVPLPGFGYSLVKGALEGIETDGWLGAVTGGVKNTAAGITAAVVFGYLVALIFDPKSKR